MYGSNEKNVFWKKDMEKVVSFFQKFDVSYNVEKTEKMNENSSLATVVMNFTECSFDAAFFVNSFLDIFKFLLCFYCNKCFKWQTFHAVSQY